MRVLSLLILLSFGGAGCAKLIKSSGSGSTASASSSSSSGGTSSSHALDPVLSSVRPNTVLVAYSVRRKLFSDYTGSLIQVRRASDDSEMDIGATASGELDQAKLLAFAAGSAAYVVQIYDQTGSSHHRMQGTKDRQPQIVDVNGNIQKDSDGRVGARFVDRIHQLGMDNAVISNDTPYTAVLSHRYTGSTGVAMLYYGGTNQYSYVGNPSSPGSVHSEYSVLQDYFNGYLITLNSRSAISGKIFSVGGPAVVQSMVGFTVTSNFNGRFYFGGYANYTVPSDLFDYYGFFFEEAILRKIPGPETAEETADRKAIEDAFMK